MRGTLTPGGKMEGADESTELWRHPKQDLTKAVKLKIRSNGPARHGAAFSSRKRNFTFLILGCQRAQKIASSSVSCLLTTDTQDVHDSSGQSIDQELVTEQLFYFCRNQSQAELELGLLLFARIFLQ